MGSRNMNVRRAASVVGCFATLASLVACGDDSADPGSSAATTTEVPAATTTLEATTTTVLATTTTTAPVVFTLRYGGLGPLDFGADPAAVIAALTERFGAPSSDISTDYPISTGGGYFENADSSFVFRLPFGRSVCWTVGLCTSFGGADSSSTTFIGWRYENDTAATLSTAEGITIGSRLSDHAGIVDPPLPCFAGMFGPESGRYAVYDGQTRIGDFPSMVITYRSDGIPFTEIPGDVEGSTPGVLPPPELTIVKQVRSGETPYSREGYCG